MSDCSTPKSKYPFMQKFIQLTISQHYPKEKFPCWANHYLFCEAVSEMLEQEIIIALQNGEKAFSIESLLCMFHSVRCSPFSDKLVDRETQTVMVNIPKSIIHIFSGYKPFPEPGESIRSV